MTSQIDGGYNANKDSNFEDLAPYLGSVNGDTETLRTNGADVFTVVGADSVLDLTNDTTFINEILGIYIWAAARGSGHNNISDSGVQTVMGDFFASYNPSSIYYKKIHGNGDNTGTGHFGAPTSIDELAQDLSYWLAYQYQPNPSQPEDPPPFRWGDPPSTLYVYPFAVRMAAALKVVLKANLGLWSLSPSTMSTDAQILLENTNFKDSTGRDDGYDLGLNNVTNINGKTIRLPYTAGNFENYGASLNTDYYSVMSTGADIPSTLGIDNFNTDPRFQYGSGVNFIADMQERAEDQLFAHWNLTSVNPAGGVAAYNSITQKNESVFPRFAYINQYQQVFSAFNETLPSGSLASATGTALRDFVYNIMYADPASQASFITSKEFGAWYSKVQQDYLTALNGVPTLFEGVLDASAAKTRIIQRIYALIVLMISTVQKTTAAQSDQLKVLTTLQGELTNMISKAPILVSSNVNVLTSSATSDASQSTTRDELNQVITAWTDTIRAKRDFQKSLAQSVQTNINTSNDAVNQQASMATALIQQQSTILSALYR